MNNKILVKFNIIFFTILILLNCSNKKNNDIKIQTKQENTEKVSQESFYSLNINVVDSKIKATVEGFDPSKYEVQWFVNGVFILKGTLLFDIKELKKGDVVMAKAIIKDKEINSNEIIIGNKPPIITKVKLMPESFKLNDTLYIEAQGVDPDGEDVYFVYEWFKNGELISKDRSIGTSVKRGDKIIAKIKPFDGKSYGSVVVLEREITNIPPIIIEHREYRFEKNMFTYQIKAEDPDGDKLNYFLKSSPKGMTINSETGFIQWNIPQDFVGKVNFTVSVSDGHGGETIQDFVFEIKKD